MHVLDHVMDVWLTPGMANAVGITGTRSNYTLAESRAGKSCEMWLDKCFIFIVSRGTNPSACSGTILLVMLSVVWFGRDSKE